MEFLRRVREERKFENPEALKAQILRDVDRAQAYFRRVGASDASGAVSGMRENLERRSKTYEFIRRKSAPHEGAVEQARRHRRGRHGSARQSCKSPLRAPRAFRRTGDRRHDERVQGRGVEGFDAARQRDSARSRVRPARRQGALLQRRPAAGLRGERLRQHQARPPAGSAAARFRQAHRGLGRECGEDFDLLLAVRRRASQRHQARLHRAHRRRSARAARFRFSWSSSATIPRAATKRAWSSPR